MKRLECESAARERETERGSPAEAHAQHYVIMTADPRKMKGHLKQPLETASSLIVQPRMAAALSGMRWTKTAAKRMRRRPISVWKRLLLRSLPAVTLAAARAFVRVRNVGNRHYESCGGMRLFT